MWTVKNENTREGNQKVLWPRLVTSAIQFHLKMRLSKLASVPDWSLWGKWDNSDYSNEKYRTNMITTCGIHVFLKVFRLVGVYVWLRNPLHCPTKKWDTCGIEETLNIFCLLSIMATNIENSSSASGSSLNADNAKPKAKSWADHVEKFSTNFNEENVFTSNDGPQFFVIKEMKVTFQKRHLF